jgi:hypothetical protein
MAVLAAFKVEPLKSLKSLNALKPLKLLGPSFAGHAVLMRARFLGASARASSLQEVQHVPETSQFESKYVNRYKALIVM